MKSRRDRKSWGRASSGRGRAPPFGAGLFPAGGWSSHAALPQSAGGGAWGAGRGGAGGRGRGGARSQPAPGARERGGHRHRFRRLSCKSPPWLPAAGAGGTGRHALGPGRLPPGAPRVGGAGHPGDLDGSAGRGRPASAKCRRGLELGWGRAGGGRERRRGGVHSQGPEGVVVLHGGRWEGACGSRCLPTGGRRGDRGCSGGLQGRREV